MTDGAAWISFNDKWADHVKNRGLMMPIKPTLTRKPKGLNTLYNKKLKLEYPTGFPHKAWRISNQTIGALLERHYGSAFKVKNVFFIQIFSLATFFVSDTFLMLS